MVQKKSMEIQTFFGKMFRIRQDTTRFDIPYCLLYKKMQKRRNYQFFKSQAIQYKAVYFCHIIDILCRMCYNDQNVFTRRGSYAAGAFFEAMHF